MKKYSSSSSLLSASVNYPIHNQYIKYQKNDNHNTSYTNYSSSYFFFIQNQIFLKKSLTKNPNSLNKI